MSTTFRIAFIVFLFLSGSTFANDSREPYQVRIVVQVEKHPQLTKIFRERIERALKDGLQAALGELAKVEVTNKHPALANIRKEGLGKALDEMRERSASRTYFVLIDYEGTHYQVQTRMHDGLTGLSTPVVRKGRTRDPEYVARTATFLMERDLAFLGTVATEPDAARQVRVDLRGGALGVDLSRWIKKGEVFQLVQVNGDAPGQPVVGGAYLQVVEPAKDGACTCKLVSRYLMSSARGLRAVLLGTQSGPLRMRVLQEQQGGGVGPVGAVTLHIRKNGFEGEDTSRVQIIPRSGREATTEAFGKNGTFDGLAFISVLSGETLKANIPVPILDDSVHTIIVPFTNEENELRLHHFRALARSVRDAVGVQNEQFKTISSLSANPNKRTEALAKVRVSLKRGQEDYNRLTEEWSKVKKELAKLAPKDRPTPEEMQAIDAKLKYHKSGEGDLLKQVTALENILKEESDPKKAESRIAVQSAKRAEAEADIGKALEIYKALPEDFLTPELKMHIEKLEQQWKPVDDKHAEARRFIYETWPALDTPGLKTHLKEAKDSFAVCEKARDTLGPTKMARVLKTHLERIEKELDDLKPGVNIKDDEPVKVIQVLLPQLVDLDKSIQAFLEKNKPE